MNSCTTSTAKDATDTETPANSTLVPRPESTGRRPGPGFGQQSGDERLIPTLPSRAILGAHRGSGHMNMSDRIRHNFESHAMTGIPGSRKGEKSITNGPDIIVTTHTNSILFAIVVQFFSQSGSTYGFGHEADRHICYRRKQHLQIRRRRHPSTMEDVPDQVSALSHEIKVQSLCCLPEQSQ